jgi:hypothetical protein
MEANAQHELPVGLTKGGTEVMRKDMVNTSMLVAAGILVAASMALAKSPSPNLGHSLQTSADVEIYTTTPIFGGPTLQAGKYMAVLDNNPTAPEIGFYQNGKLVAKVPAKLVDQGREFDETAFSYDDAAGGGSLAMTEMDVAGWSERVLFGQNHSDAGSTK